MAHHIRPTRDRAPSRHDLTPREVQVVRFVVRGFKNRQIAERLGVHVKTVEAHRASAYLKWRVQNTATLVRAALRCGIR